MYMYIYIYIYIYTHTHSVVAHCKDGAFVSGMFLEGARWEPAAMSLEEYYIISYHIIS